MLADLLKQEVTEGKVYDLGQPYHPGMPHWPGGPPFALNVLKMHTDAVQSDGYAACVETYATVSHLGTHIDAIGHVSMHGKAFGGVPVAQRQKKTTGLEKLGIDESPPLLARGVLVDVARLKNVDILPGGYEISSADFEAAVKMSGAAVREGDAVFVRTGWSRHYSDAPRYLAEAAPGPGPEAARWLARKHVSLTGSDTPAYEKTPNNNFPAHVVLLVENGIHIVEWMNLESLSEAGVSTFVSVIVPLRIVGASGSPVRPIGIR